MLNSTQKGIKYSLEPRSAILLTSVLFLQVRLVHVHLNTIPCGSNGKEFATVQETQVQSLGQEAPLEKGMTTHSIILAWRIPRTEKSERVHGVTKSWT